MENVRAKNSYSQVRVNVKVRGERQQLLSRCVSSRQSAHRDERVGVLGKNRTSPVVGAHCALSAERMRGSEVSMGIKHMSELALHSRWVAGSTEGAWDDIRDLEENRSYALYRDVLAEGSDRALTRTAPRSPLVVPACRGPIPTPARPGMQVLLDRIDRILQSPGCLVVSSLGMTALMACAPLIAS